MAKDKKEPSLFAGTEEIISLLAKDSPQDVVIVVIPSHDQKKNELPAALIAEWVDSGMRLLADLYRGATAYQSYGGIFKTDEGHYLHDKPMLLETFATIEAIHDPEKLELLVNFAKRMGKTLDQDTVMLIFGTISYYIKDYSGV